MSRTVIEQKHEVNSWKYHLEDVKGVLKLQDHVFVGPVAFAILTIFKEDKKRRFVTSEWAFVCTSKNLDVCVMVSILFSLALKNYFINHMLTNPSHEAMFAVNACRYHGSNSFNLRE
jgi:hypothetical protein